jgi:hypothetical protein
LGEAFYAVVAVQVGGGHLEYEPAVGVFVGVVFPRWWLRGLRGARIGGRKP